MAHLSTQSFSFNVTVGDGLVTLPRQFNEDGSPKGPCVWGVQLWGTPPPYDGKPVPVSLPYYSVMDVNRVRARADRFLPRWNFEVREVYVPAAITRDDADALFRKWGW